MASSALGYHPYNQGVQPNARMEVYDRYGRYTSITGPLGDGTVLQGLYDWADGQAPALAERTDQGEFGFEEGCSVGHTGQQPLLAYRDYAGQGYEVQKQLSMDETWTLMKMVLAAYADEDVTVITSH